MPKQIKNKGVELAIEESGGTTYTLAKLCKVSQPAVVYWLYHSIPAKKCLLVERLTGVPRESMRPDLFT